MNDDKNKVLKEDEKIIYSNTTFNKVSSHPHVSSQSNKEPISILHKKVSFSPSEISDGVQTPNGSGHNRRTSLRSGDVMVHIKEDEEILSLQDGDPILHKKVSFLPDEKSDGGSSHHARESHRTHHMNSSRISSRARFAFSHMFQSIFHKMKSSVYHREVLTAITGDLEAPESKSSRNGKLNMGVLFLCLGLLVAIVLIPGFVLFHKQGLMFMLDLTETEHRFEYIVICLSFLPICIFMIWSIRQVAIAETAKLCFSRTSLLLVLCLLIEHLKVISSEMTEEELEHINMFVLNRALAFSIFSFWMSLMDDVVLWVHSFADQLEKIAQENPESEEWKKKMKKASKFGDKKIDAAYSIPGGSRSPSRVLAEVTGVYCNLGKALGFMLLFLFMVGVDLYSSLVIFGVTVLFAAIIQALHINEAMSNLIPLAISNAIHIGEIVAVSRAGYTPGHNPDKTHVGFVEGVTWSHIVIRDLSRKQIFVPHQEAQTKILSNWSRRPSKPIWNKMVIIPSLGGGVDKFPKLIEFIRQYMKVHPDIDHDDYQKVGITFGGYGEAFLIFKCIVTDVDKAKKVCTDLTITIMKACHRLNIMLIDAGHRDWKLDEDLDLNANDENKLEDLEDLMPTYVGYQQ